LATETFRSIVSQLYQNSPKQCSLAYIPRHSDRNDLIFFSHFKNVSVYDRKITEKPATGLVETRWLKTVERLISTICSRYRCDDTDTIAPRV